MLPFLGQLDRSLPDPFYYLSYKPPAEALKRVTLSNQLRDLGCSRLHFSFWKVPRSKVRWALEVVRAADPLILRRSREVTSPVVNRAKGVYDLGSLTVFAYHAGGLKPGVRAAVARMLRRMPHIRLGKSLYATPHIRSSRYDLLRSRILLPSDFFDALTKLRVETHRLMYMRVVYPSSQQALYEQLIGGQVKSCHDLLRRSQLLMKQPRSSGGDTRRLRKILSGLKTRYLASKGVAYFLYRTMGVDLRPLLKDVYNSLVTCKRFVDERG